MSLANLVAGAHINKYMDEMLCRKEGKLRKLFIAAMAMAALGPLNLLYAQDAQELPDQDQITRDAANAAVDSAPISSELAVKGLSNGQIKDVAASKEEDAQQDNQTDESTVPSTLPTMDSQPDQGQDMEPSDPSEVSGIVGGPVIPKTPAELAQFEAAAKSLQEVMKRGYQMPSQDGDSIVQSGAKVRSALSDGSNSAFAPPVSASYVNIPSSDEPGALGR